MSSKREDLLNQIQAHFKAEEKYEFEQELSDAFKEWNQICYVRNTGKRYQIAFIYSDLDSNRIKARSVAEKIDSKYRSLISFSGKEGYEGIAYLIEYLIQFVHQGEATIEVPGPIVELATIDLNTIQGKDKPEL